MMKAMYTKGYAGVLALLVLSTACTSTRFEPGTNHPASAKAETAPLPQPGLLLASSVPAPLVPAEAAHGHQHGTPLADQYTCPMHPEIVKDAPGKCPICGMNLVKKETAAPRGASH